MTHVIQRDPQRAFYGAVALLFVASAAATIAWCASMSTMPGMPMPGGWTMSMTWMRMPGQSWIAAGVSFLGMWMLMMTAMMLPSLAPALMRYRRANRDGDVRIGLPTLLVGAGYFLVWAACGVVVYPSGIALASAEMQLPALARAVPLAAGILVLLAGALQISAWKARQLACCRFAADLAQPVSTSALAALKQGAHLGTRCVACCAGLMLVLLAVGVMDLRAMAAITAAITVERLAGERAAQAIGVVVIGAAIYLIGRALRV